MTIAHDHNAPHITGSWAPDSPNGVREAVREAVAMRTPLRIVGLGTWLDAGHPTPSDARPLRLDALDGILQYTPGDLTLTARAGTPLATIDAAAAKENQWLPLDPFCSAAHGGSIGATIATASAGPLSHALGLPRDIVLGLEAVTGDGALIQAGGRVVKNVAGFDITRLLTGAWGTLGVLTEVTVRLRGRPTCDETVAIVRRDAAGHLDDLVRALRSAAAAPIALEVLNPRLASALSILPGVTTPIVLARIAGNVERVAAERTALAGVGDLTSVPTSVWTALRGIESGATNGSAVLRWSALPAHLGATWAHVTTACQSFGDAMLHATAGRGIVRAIIPHPGSAALSAGIAEDTAPWHATLGHDLGRRFAGACIPERLPPWLWGAVGTEAMRDPLSRRVRRAFDPAHILNPGLLGEASGE
jgi:glycolate oxidase FAD binding subunit